jgi:hypothetical protein
MEFLKITENHGNSDKNTDFLENTENTANDEKHGKHGFRVFMFFVCPYFDHM